MIFTRIFCGFCIAWLAATLAILAMAYDRGSDGAYYIKAGEEGAIPVAKALQSGLINLIANGKAVILNVAIDSYKTENGRGLIICTSSLYMENVDLKVPVRLSNIGAGDEAPALIDPAVKPRVVQCSPSSR